MSRSSTPHPEEVKRLPVGVRRHPEQPMGRAYSSLYARRLRAIIDLKTLAGDGSGRREKPDGMAWASKR